MYWETALVTQVGADELPGALAVAYIRVSSKEQAEKGGEAEGFSIPAQREACSRKAASLQAALIEQFVERGESAKTADRPELQRMLRFIAEHPVKYVIVHKVDRLARNRADDVAINLAIRQAGAELVSVSENIDQTPSGLLLHGIMASISEFYSRNLATEVIKGTTQKAKNGGTPSRAPTGYLNVQRTENGREVRTIKVDPERGPLMRWAFETYATGEWTIRRLLAELTARGLTTAPGRQKAGRPLGVSHLHTLLRNPYYMGMVRYRGAIYAGRHEPLVTPEIWQEVQKVLSAKYLTGEKDREHPHYLKGSIYCGQCGARLIVNHAKGNGGSYAYFVCGGRQRNPSSCKQRAVLIEVIEAAIIAYYGTVQLPAEEVERLRTFLGEELDKLRSESGRERGVQERRLLKFQGEREKLLQAHYADAIPLEMLKTEQDRLTTAIAAAEGRLAAIAADFRTAETNLNRALDRAADCQLAYREATGRMRRQFNLAFFKRLIISDEGIVSGELAEPWDVILAEELHRAVAAREAESLTEAIEEAQRNKKRHPSEPGLALVGATAAAPALGDGWSPNILVRPSGLEPPRTVKSTRPSTLRVYQFRHGRRGASIASASWQSPDAPWAPALHPSTAAATVRTHVRHTRQSTRTGRQPEMDLTKRQQEIFDFIRKYSAKYGYPPTVRDIGKAVGLASSSTVHAHLANLEKIGLLRRDPSKPRAIELLDRAVGSAVDSVRGIVRAEGLPLLGSVAAGQPMLAEENIEEYVSVPELAGGEDGEYVLRIRGDSMKEAGILEGDFVVVHPQDTATDGDVVVALLGEEATVKRFFREPDHIRLQPENETMEPIRSKEVKVLGRVVGLLRRV
jgi:site-specific DNA recombinase